MGNMERYNQFIEASRSSLGVVLGDLVDVVARGIVPCVSKIDTLGLFHSLLKEKFAGYNAGRAVGGGAHAR